MPATRTLKVCAKCNKIKRIEKFMSDRREADGFHPICETCALMAAGKGKIKRTKKKCPICEQILPVSMFYRNAGGSSRDSLSWHCKRCSRELSVSAIKGKPDYYNRKNREIQRIRRAVPGNITEAERQELFDKYERKCLCCKRPEGVVELTIDHVIPLSRGGENTLENAQVLCRGCNAVKGDKEYEYRPEVLARGEHDGKDF